MREVSQPPNARRDRDHPRGPGRVAHWLPVLLVVALLAGAVAAHRFEVGPRHLPWLVADPASEPQAVPPPAGLDLPDWDAPTPAVAAAEPGEVDVAAVERALRRPLRDPDLGRRVNVAVGSLDGDGTGWATGPGTFIPASTTKVLTAAATLQTLGPNARFTTRVVRGQGPREVVLVGGGDPYLASTTPTPEEAAGTYPPRADVASLAAAVADALGGRGRVRVRYDDSLFSGPADNPAWRRDYVRDDIVSPITALMVDGGREADGWHRYDDPSLAAAQAFARALADAGLRVVGAPRPGRADDAAEELAVVEGAPVNQVVERMLEVSDNEAAEVLARHVGLARSGSGTFDAGSRGVVEALAEAGVDTGATRIHDGSGLSRRNVVSAEVLLDVLRAAARTPRLRATLTGLPVAGFSGSLTWRFEDEAPVSRGAVRAKTGTLSGVHALAGIVTDREGTPLVFVVAVDRSPEARKLDAQLAVDHVAAALATCDCSRPPR
ncbi:MAG: D-alanyl-D-alanine carboxypeptidase/D-alanyl-D-alanine-endopeptidase [Nocardioides sp.]|nr:D-alanyl-D-alanine carboxypeptidase/D-alanyl-D-alanine-endopeptidase [Nocardioides sp.]